MIFNENDRYPAAWLRNLFSEATVDERSILDLQAADLAGHTRAHFFAGVGGWEYALQLAGWPEDREVWTGSCPCQPFSVAGKGLGTADARHLWPEFRRLIAECRPTTIFGEQVASRAGREWLAGVRADLEALGYAVGAADLCAASVGAPHIRQRLFWVADRTASGRREERQDGGGLAPRDGAEGRAAGSEPSGDARGVADADGGRRGQRGERDGGAQRGVEAPHGYDAGGWDQAVPLLCLDGKTRRVEPGIFPLAHGVPGRVGRLRAYGNAIVPQVAATFVRSFMEATHE